MEVKFNKLKGLIAENEMTHSETAEVIDVSPNTFSRKINKISPFTLAEAKKLADYFGVTIEELFFSTDVTNREQSA